MNRPPQTTSATIELETGTEAPTGALTDGHGQARRFDGWIELAAAIEDWRTSTTQAETATSASRSTGLAAARPTHDTETKKGNPMMRSILKRLSRRHGSAGRLTSCFRMRRGWLATLAVAGALVVPQAAHAFDPLGQDMRISFMGPDGNTSYDASDARVAYNPAANEYLVVWAGDDNTSPLVDNEFEIFAQRVSASGAPLSGRIRISDMGPDGNTSYSAGQPSVAYNPAASEYLVIWPGEDNTAPLVDGEQEIFGQRLTAAGVEAGANDFRISDMGPNGNVGYSAADPSVAYSSAANEYLVVWQGDDNTAPLVDGEYEVFGQRLTAAGVEAGANDFRISDMGPNGNTTFGADEPSVAYSSAANEYLVAWQGDDDTAPLVDNEHEIFGQRLTAAGAGAGANDFRISDMGPNGNTAFSAHDARVTYNRRRTSTSSPGGATTTAPRS